MRGPVLVVSLLACASLAVAQEVVRLGVGERYPGAGTIRPICDAPSVAIIVDGAIQAVGPGETVCSAATVQAQGTRRVFRVIVTTAAHRESGGRDGGAARD
jgi:hypothetical protein